MEIKIYTYAVNILTADILILLSQKLHQLCDLIPEKLFRSKNCPQKKSLTKAD